MKIAYVSTFDPLDIRSWSGCSYFLARELNKRPCLELDFIGPLKEVDSPVFRVKGRWNRMIGKNYLATLEPQVLRDYARQCAIALSISKPDVILSLDAAPIAYLETTKPIIYFWDCTFQGNLEYPWFSNLAPESIRYGHDMERRALEKCQVAVYSSEWAVQTAVDTYKIDRNKIRIAALGANLECRRDDTEIVRIINSRERDKCKLLFLGVDWYRKGGDVAFAVAQELNSRGVPTTLTVVGCQPEIKGEAPNWFRCLGFVNKFEDNNFLVIENLLAESHFLIVPSLAESFGAVFCEASSFGTPSIARRVGGIPNAVRDGVNGQLFEKDAPISEYCEYVEHHFGAYDEYCKLALSSFSEFKKRLNWGRTSEFLAELFNEVTPASDLRPAPRK